jgi:ABC-2 type transport system permease protein
MLKELRFALYCMKKNMQSSAELRTSFIINIVAMMINNLMFLLIWVFFANAVGTVGGWSAYDVIGLCGFNSLCYGVMFSIFSGIRKLPDYTTSGAFDRFLLSPKNILLRTLTSQLVVSGIGDICYGLICLAFYASIIHATIAQIALALCAIVITIAVFFAVSVCAYSLSFFVTDATSAANAAFELFFTPSMFHGGAFQGALRIFFIFVVPSLLISALPVEAMRDLDVGKLVLMCALAIIWCAGSIWIFYRGIRRYESANFMTFGA